MKKQVSGISIKQSAKFIAVLYFIVSAIICVPFGIYAMIQFGFSEGGFIVFAPLLYGLFSFIFFVIFAFIYNVVADLVGGLEFEIKDAE